MGQRFEFDAGARFEIRRQLGSGGMGVVFEAFDRERAELVALKALHRLDPRSLARFKREFRALHDLAHPNLVALGEFFDGQSEPFFTMELVRGTDFLSHVRPGVERSKRGQAFAATMLDCSRDGGSSADPGATRAGGRAARAADDRPRFDEPRLRGALGQLALAVSALHDAGSVHRDIKPSNVLVTSSGRALLLDFGLIADRRPASEPPAELNDELPRAGASLLSQHSMDAAIVGTATYMAPEQALSGQVTAAADWYSLGVMLFEALTGVPPHAGKNQFDLLVRKQSEVPARPAELVSGVPADLDELCTGLLRADPAERPSAGVVLERLGMEAGPATALGSAEHSLSWSSPFVGRHGEMAGLHAAYVASQQDARIVLVEGISGVGKSQLVEEFLERTAVAHPDAVILSARCYEREVVAYKAVDGIADTLASYLAHLDTASAAALMPLRAGLLGRLFPIMKRVEAVALAPAVPDLADPQDQRRRMFEALRELFARLVERHPVIWYIDDLQWTDADSLVLLQELLGHEDPLPVLLVATLRPPEDERARAELLSLLGRLARVDRIALSELAPDEARQLAGMLLPGQDAVDVAAIAHDAGGHPLYLHELARHNDATGVREGPMPSFETMLAARIEQLAPDAQRLLKMVCLFGGPVSQEVAAVAAGMSAAEQARATRVLRAAHLVRTDGVRRTDRMLAYHDRVREHVATRLADEERVSIHERLSLALERTGVAAAEPRAMVRHARAAGRRELAASHALSAAREAAGALAFDQAAELFAAALELGVYAPNELRARRIELATTLMQAGRGPEAAEMFMTAAEGAEPAVRLDCQRQAADQWMVTGHLERALEVLEALLADIGEQLAATPRRALARIVWNRLRLRLRGTRAKTRLASQIPAETLQRLEVIRAAAHGLAMVDNIRGADFNARFLLLALRTGEVRRLVGALGSEVVFLSSQSGRPGRRAWRLHAELVALADQCDDQPYAQCWVLLSRGAMQFFDGQLTDSISSLEASEDIFAQGHAGLTLEKNNCRVFRVHTLRLLGALRQQGALSTWLIRAGLQRGDHYIATTLQTLQVVPLLARHDVDGAIENIESARWTPPERGYHLQHWNKLRACSDLALYRGTVGASLADMLPEFDRLQRSMLLRVTPVRADAISLRARLLLAAARDGRVVDDALAQVKRAASRLEREIVPYAAVYAHLLRAGLGALDSRQTEAQTVEHLRAAIELAQATGMALHLAAAQARLAELVGGDEGAALREATAAYSAHERVAHPEQLFELVAPGFVPG